MTPLLALSWVGVGIVAGLGLAVVLAALRAALAKRAPGGYVPPKAKPTDKTVVFPLGESLQPPTRKDPK